MSAKQTSICLFNTLTRKKETFIPITPGKVKLYTCGPTVYDYAHIGNFRAFLFEDLLKRWLTYRGYNVIHIMNLTDIDDKTIKGSQKQGQQLREYTNFYANAFFEDIKALNIQPADVYPRATEHIREMVAIIQTLLKKGVAYKGEDGSIYFSVAKFPSYGKLSHLKMGELVAGARVSQDEYTKEQAQDFALWKAWTQEDGNVYWDTELQRGRPGWHIECSAMSMKYLGETFDIHCGGIDNMFPHHENEIAQSEAATGKTFVNYWMHNEHLQVEGKKMSKRFGNFYTLRDLLAKGYDPITIRYLLISTHYRQQFNFTFEGLEASKAAVERLRNFVRRLHEAEGTTSTEKVKTLVDKLEACFGGSMDDDLNIGIALSSLFDFVREMNSLLDANLVSKEQATEIADSMMRIDNVLGIIGKVEVTQKKAVLSPGLSISARFIAVVGKISDEDMALVNERENARVAKMWKRADEIRAELKSKGIILEDSGQGVTVRTEKA